MAIEKISAEEFAELAPKVDANQAAMRNGLHPFPDIGNEETGKVEQYRLLTETPDYIVAYLGEPNRNGTGLDRVLGQSYPVTVWTGQKIGFATLGSSWRVNSYIGSTMGQYYATINGREFTGRGFGAGMSIVLRETAASKRARGV